jgi:hypothetical protein
MRRTRPIVIGLALVVAACGQTSADSTTVATTVPTTEPAPEAVQLSYGFEPGTTLQYEVSFDQQLTMSTSGDSAALGEEEMPGQADLGISGVTTFTHNVEEGAEPGTFDIAIRGDFTDLTVTGTVDGEPVDSGEIPELADIEPVETTITVDEKGNVISTGEEDLGLGGALGGDPSALGALGSPGMDFGTLIGPPLADREVTVGDTWSETVEEPMPFGEDSFTTTVDNEVTGTDTVDGADVFVIETISKTSLIEFDLAEMMIGFFAAFMPEEATPEERAELEAMMAEVRFMMTIQPSDYATTSWFDPAAGYARRAETAGASQITFDVNFPDETTGGLVAFAMDMAIDQTVSYRLVEAAGA